MLPLIIRIRVQPLKVVPQVQLRAAWWSGCLRLRQALAKLAAQDFSGCCFRNRIHETDSSWLLERSEAVGNVGAEFVFHFLAGSEAAAQGNEGHRNFSGLGIGTSDDPAVAYRRVLEQKSFHLRWRHSETLVLDHFFNAVNYVVKILFVTTHDVARPIPTIAQHCGGGLRIVPVSRHELRAPHDEFAGLASWDFLPIFINHPAFGLR